MSTVTEEWRDLPSNIYHKPIYQVSSQGRIRNKHTGHIIHQSVNGDGYRTVRLGHHDTRSVHRLVCETFRGGPPNERSQVNHIDCDRQNNHINNLEWCSPSENIKWAISHGQLDPMVGLKKATEVNRKSVRLVETNQHFSSLQECANYLGVTRGNVSRCLTGERKGQTIHGYHVDYI